MRQLGLALCLALGLGALGLWLAREAPAPAADELGAAGTVPAAAERGADAAPEGVGNTLASVPARTLVEPDAPLETDPLRTLPPGRLRGRVVDDRGRPLPDAAVTVVCDGDDAPTIVRTGVDGGFALENLPPVHVDVGAAHDAHAPTELANREAVVISGDTVTLADLVLAPPFHIDGVVVDDDRLPVADAEVGATLLDAKYDRGAWFGPTLDPIRVRSAADGSFTVRVARGRTWRIHAADGGAEDATTLVAGEDPSRVRLVLPRSRTFELEVVDAATRAPIEGFTILVRGKGSRAIGQQLGLALHRTPFDAQTEVAGWSTGPGRRTLALRVDDATTIDVRSESHVGVAFEWSADAPADSDPRVFAVIALTRAAHDALTVRVVDETGAPRADVTVALFEDGDGPARESSEPSQTGPEATTDENGIAMIRFHERGARFVMIKDRRVPAERTPWFTLDPATDAVVHELRIRVAATLRGRLRRRGTDVVGHARLVLERDDGIRQATWTADDGSFHMPQLAPGTYRLYPGLAMFANPAPPAPSFTLRAGETHECFVDPDAFDLGAIAGHVRVGGQPAPGVEVQVDTSGGGNFCVSGVDGSFAMAAVLPERAIVAFHRGGELVALREVSIVAGTTTTLDVDLTLVTAAGTIVDAATGQPVPRCTLDLVPLADGRVGRDDDPFAPHGIEVESDDRGHWRITALEPGRYVTTVRSPWDHHPTTTRVLDVGPKATDHEIRLFSACAVTCVVPNGDPEARFRLTLSRLEVPWTEDATSATPGDIAELRNLDPGVWHARLWIERGDAGPELVRDLGALTLGAGETRELDASSSSLR
jgi:hypothetical protein